MEYRNQEMKQTERCLPQIDPGNYRLLYPLRIREGAGLNYRAVNPGTFAGNTGEDPRPDGTLASGTKMKITEIKYLSVSVWGRMEAGWICLYMNGGFYAVLQEDGRACC